MQNNIDRCGFRLNPRTPLWLKVSFSLELLDKFGKCYVFGNFRRGRRLSSSATFILNSFHEVTAVSEDVELVPWSTNVSEYVQLVPLSTNVSEYIQFRICKASTMYVVFAYTGFMLNNSDRCGFRLIPRTPLWLKISFSLEILDKFGKCYVHGNFRRGRRLSSSATFILDSFPETNFQKDIAKIQFDKR